MYTTNLVVNSEALTKRKKFENKLRNITLILSLISIPAMIIGYVKFEYQNAFLFGICPITALGIWITALLVRETFSFPPYTIVFRDDGYVALDTGRETRQFLLSEKPQFLIGDYSIGGPVTWNYDGTPRESSEFLRMKLEIEDALRVYDITVTITNQVPKQAVIGMCLNNPLPIQVCAMKYSTENTLVDCWIKKKLIKFQQENMAYIVEIFSDKENENLLADSIVDFFTEEFQILDASFVPVVEVKIAQSGFYMT